MAQSKLDLTSSCKVIIVIGSSGSGKTTVAQEIAEQVKETGLSVAILSLDHYYLPKSRIDPTAEKNFDVPEALDQALIRSHLNALEVGKTIPRPTYDMPSSDRVIDGEVQFPPKDVIIVEGIFAGECLSYLKKQTDKLTVYIQSSHVTENYTRKAERDSVERQKSEAHIKAMKKNQIGCLFKYVAPHMNSAQITIENTWQPACTVSDNIMPMIIGDKLDVLREFLTSTTIYSPYI
ncbi:uridine kinase [Legionella antarctica]|uniref:Uridine kinase n=1 Tax=Legionella antarctica TaxID=2708020 RepID=A0A6F8T6B9_9GAMM|nr:AAA family ATPase [Legionella antarctica]BCA95753.1 uridine kinase [Legionella antarctica]